MRKGFTRRGELGRRKWDCHIDEAQTQQRTKNNPKGNSAGFPEHAPTHYHTFIQLNGTHAHTHTHTHNRFRGGIELIDPGFAQFVLHRNKFLHSQNYPLSFYVLLLWFSIEDNLGPLTFVLMENIHRLRVKHWLKIKALFGN